MLLVPFWLLATCIQLYSMTVVAWSVSISCGVSRVVCRSARCFHRNASALSYFVSGYCRKDARPDSPRGSLYIRREFYARQRHPTRVDVLDTYQFRVRVGG